MPQRPIKELQSRYLTQHPFLWTLNSWKRIYAVTPKRRLLPKDLRPCPQQLPNSCPHARSVWQWAHAVIKWKVNLVSHQIHASHDRLQIILRRGPNEESQDDTQVVVNWIRIILTPIKGWVKRNEGGQRAHTLPEEPDILQQYHFRRWTCRGGWSYWLRRSYVRDYARICPCIQFSRGLRPVPWPLKASHIHSGRDKVEPRSCAQRLSQPD